MVVSSKSASLYLRKSFGKDETSIIGIQQLIPSMALDPTLNNPAHDIYIVTSDDINKKKIAGEFESAAARKHPAVKNESGRRKRLNENV